MGFVDGTKRKPRNRKVTEEKLLVTHNGNLYDITDFADKHPGGKDILREHKGRDVTETMKRIDPHQHSDAAYAILEKYNVDNVDSSNTQECAAATKLTPTNGYIRGTSYPYKDDLVDWDKPIFDQIPALGDAYFEWVHTAVDRPLRLFHSDFVEFFSKCPWWLVPVVWVPVTCLLLHHAFTHLVDQSDTWLTALAGGVPIGAGSMPVVYGSGVLMWTLLEYSIHRWLFHLRPITNHPFFILTHFILHGQHHKSPMDRMRLVFPTFPAVCFAIVFFHIYCLIFPMYMAMTFMAGTITGYMFYDLIHYYLHHGGTMTTEYFRDLKSYHVDHHYKQYNRGFGISSKLWDYPFGTLVKPSE